MAKLLKLKQGMSYTYRNKKYMKGKSEPVDDVTFNHLMSTGKFEVAEVSAKVRIKKPDDAEVETEEETETEENKIPTFRSKQALADYALKEYGLEFEGDFDDLKMKDMMEVLTEHLKSEEETESEPSVEV